MTTTSPLPGTIEHCIDCCCARSWTALRVTKYDGKSISEHIDALVASNAELVAALEILADIPLESFDKHNKPDYPLMGWNGHVLKVHHVLAARAAIAKANAHL